jgi:hypothetical protein
LNCQYDKASREEKRSGIGSVDPKCAISNIRMPVLSLRVAGDPVAPFHNDSFGRVFSLNLVERPDDETASRLTDPREKMRRQLGPASQWNIIKMLYVTYSI